MCFWNLKFSCLYIPYPSGILIFSPPPRTPNLIQNSPRSTDHRTRSASPPAFSPTPSCFTGHPVHAPDPLCPSPHPPHRIYLTDKSRPQHPIYSINYIGAPAMSTSPTNPATAPVLLHRRTRPPHRSTTPTTATTESRPLECLPWSPLFQCLTPAPDAPAAARYVSGLSVRDACLAIVFRRYLLSAHS